MTTSRQKLERDLEILEAMAKGMTSYLETDILFMPMPDYASMPNLSLGGYLLRQYRLQALIYTYLNDMEQKRLEVATAQFDEAVSKAAIAFESKAQRELHARLRQWDEYLEELDESDENSIAYYASAVETRVVIADILKKIYTHPFQVEFYISERINQLDRKLRIYWRLGQFIWPTEWQAAYPQEIYWWLYGCPISFD